MYVCPHGYLSVRMCVYVYGVVCLTMLQFVGTYCTHSTYPVKMLVYLLFTEDGEGHLQDTEDEADTEVIDVTDPEVFLLVYKWYLSPEKLVDCLIE